MSNILIVGGAGYIGSHMTQRALQCGHSVTVLDNLSTGYADALLPDENLSFVNMDIQDRPGLDALFAGQQFEAVMHFASFIQVGESVVDPCKYYVNNVSATLSLLGAMVNAGVKKFIFSSTAAVYGNPVYVPIDEDHPKVPINPYGGSKLMVEQILKDFDIAYGMKSVALRYFNAAGADPLALLGERHEPETHLIPLVLQVAAGRRKAIKVFGRDYETKDGTCIRDYVHVCDLVDAHLLAVDYLFKGGDSSAFNLGNGHGFSVHEVIETAREVTGCDIDVEYADARAGDPPVLLADASLARKVLGWAPRFASLDTIIADAWRWERNWPWGRA